MNIEQKLTDFNPSEMTHGEIRTKLQGLDTEDLNQIVGGHYGDLYQKLAHSDAGSFGSMPEGALNKLGELDESLRGVNGANLEAFASLARSVSEEEFIEIMKSGDLPPVQLTDAELEMLKGGLNKWVAAGSAVASLGGGWGVVGCIAACVNDHYYSLKKPRPKDSGDGPT